MLTYHEATGLAILHWIPVEPNSELTPLLVRHLEVRTRELVSRNLLDLDHDLASRALGFLVRLKPSFSAQRLTICSSVAL